MTTLPKLQTRPNPFHEQQLFQAATGERLKHGGCCSSLPNSCGRQR